MTAPPDLPGKGPWVVARWAPHDAERLAALWNNAAPTEPLTADELAGVCFDDGGVVLGTSDSTGVVAAVVRPGDDGPVGHIRLVAVDPVHRRQGLGAALMQKAEQWLVDHGARTLCLGADAPVYLWPGVDATDVATSCLAESLGYAPTTAAVNMALSPTLRIAAPERITIRRVVTDDDVAEVRDMVARVWPKWLVELDLGIDTAGVHAAFGEPGGEPVGFCAHSVLRTGWLGPIGVVTDVRHLGVGGALVSAACTDAMVAGINEVTVSWVGPIGFYASLGGRVSQVFRRWEKPAG